MLQIISSGKPFGQVQEDEVLRLNGRIKDLEAELAKRDNALGYLREDVTKLMAEFRAWKADQDVS